MRGEGLVEQADLELLVERARHSDAEAWEALFVSAYPGLIAFARRRLIRRDMADDAVSETFERAYMKIKSFRWRDGGFNAWLYTILRNVTREMSRRYRSDVLSPDLTAVQDPSPDPLHALLHDEEAAALRAAFARLRPEEQEVLELRVLGKLDSREAASLLGKKPVAVRMAQSRALERLRLLMREAVRA
jgi:RNA polymerase sigma-70 factor (ECF subfamily)